jgi:glucose dehydrogenase
LRHFTFLISIFIFAGTAMLLRWRNNKKVLKKYELIFLGMVAFSVPYAGFDYFALKWHAWVYGPESTFSVQFGAELETYLYASAVTFVVVGAVLRSAARVDKQYARKRVISKTRQRKLRPALSSNTSNRR